MCRLLFLLVMTSAIAGCASTLPTCDGQNRRPINEPARADTVYPSCGATA